MKSYFVLPTKTCLFYEGISTENRRKIQKLQFARSQRIIWLGHAVKETKLVKNNI